MSRGLKPVHFCSRDGCGNLAKWEVELVIKNTPLRGLSTLTVCDDHKDDAKAYILNDENRDTLVKTLISENWSSPAIAHGVVKYNADVEFLPLKSVVEAQA